MSTNERAPLPPGWAVARLPDLVGVDGVLTDGDWVETKDQDPSGDVRLTQLADVGDGFFRDRSHRFMSMQKAIGLNCTFLQPGDVMIARMPDPLGRACIFPGSSRPCVTVVDVCVVRLPAGGANSRWLMNFVNAPDSRVAIAALQSGSTRKRISKKNLCTISLPIPPVREQQRIADMVDSYFSRLDDAVATLKRVERNLKRYRASVLKAAVEGRLVPTEAELAKQERRDYEPATVLLQRILKERRRRWEEAEVAKMEAKGKPPNKDSWKAKYKEPAAPVTTDLPELPHGWCWASVEQLTSEARPICYGVLKAGPHVDGGVPLVRVTDVVANDLRLSSLKHCAPERESYFARARLQPGDLLVSKDGTIGRVAVVPPHLDGANVTQHVLRVVASRLLCLPYARRVLEAPWAQSWMKGEVRGVALQGINVRDFRRLPIALPPITEQQRIAEVLERILSVVDSSETQTQGGQARGRRLREAILKWAFEGKLADQVLNDQPASVLLGRIKAQREAVAAARKTLRRTGGGKKVISA